MLRRSLFFSKKLILFFAVFLSGSALSAQPWQTTNSVQDGTWAAGPTWDGGAPGCNVSSEIMISHRVVCNCDPLDIAGNGSITIEDGGKLIVTSSTGLTGNGDLNIENGGELEVQGNLDIGGNGDLVNDGTVVVEGDLDVGGNGDANGSGDLNVGGSGCEDWEGPGNCTEGAVLPVELLSFDGHYRNGSVELRWRTATEKENDHFRVERSPNTEDWERVRVVQGAGTTQEVRSYSVSDRSLPSAGTHYYRLVQVDRNGEQKLYGPLAVEVEEQEKDLEVRPNPVRERAIVKGGHVSGPRAVVTVRDLTGRIVFQEERSASSGGGIEIHRSSFGEDAGVYLLSVRDPLSGESRTARVVVNGSR